MLPDKVDLTPLVRKLHAKTQSGKIAWQTTAQDGVFAATVGEGSFRLRQRDISEEWEREPNVIPFLDLYDSDGRLTWSVSSQQVDGGLFGLYELAQRVANRVDERVQELLVALDELD